jgi:hypothetical protein
VHGGALVALMDAAARARGGPAGPRAVHCRLTGAVPTDTALALDARADAAAAAVEIARDGQPLASCAIAAGAAAPAVPPWTGGGAGAALPVTERCLACGRDNPLGLGAGLRFDADGVWARLEPPPAWRLADGRPDPAVAPVLLDEAAWWLGALTMREGGLTNRIALAWLHAALPAGAPLVAGGRFADVVPIDRRRAFWRVEVALADAAGTPLCTASVVFRGGPEYSTRQLPYFRARTPAGDFARMFPGYAG